MWAWGRNDRGQLGRGTTSSQEVVPARVAVLNRVTKISAGRDFAQTQVSGPVQVTNMGGATQVAAGRLSSYAVHTVLVLTGQSS